MAPHRTFAGPVTWTAGTFHGALASTPVTIAPSGSLTISGDDNKDIRRALINQGAEAVSGGTVHVTLGGTITNAVGATWTVNGPHVLSTLGGGGSISNAGTITRTGAVDVFTIAVPFTNTGTVRVRLGGPATSEFDRLNVSAATLGGTLDVQLTNGFVPASGNTFDVITGTLTGTFGALDGNGQAYSVSYPAGIVRLTKP